MDLVEAKNILEKNGYILNELFPFGRKKEEKKEDDGTLQPWHLPGGRGKGNYYPGLIFQILKDINITYRGSITKAKAKDYVNLLLTALKDNPNNPNITDAISRVIDAIE